MVLASVWASPGFGATPATTTLPGYPGPLAQLIDLTGSSAVTGGKVTLEGMGFDPNETITIVAHSVTVVLGRAQADGSGTFSATVTIPTNLPPGQHQIVATGDTSGRTAAILIGVAVGTPAPAAATAVPAAAVAVAGSATTTTTVPAAAAATSPAVPSGSSALPVTGSGPSPSTGSAPGTSGTRSATTDANNVHVMAAMTQSVATAGDIHLTTKNLVGSALAAGGTITLILFPSELFNATLKSNYDDVMGLLSPVRRFGRRFSGLRSLRPGKVLGVVGYCAAGAVIACFIEPGLHLGTKGLAFFASQLFALIVPLALASSAEMWVGRRAGAAGTLRLRPASLLLAVACVLLSRVVHILPGYLYGLVAGAWFIPHLEHRDSGRAKLWSEGVRLALALGAWLALGPLKTAAAHPHAGIGVVLAADAMAALCIGSLTSLIMNLLPITFFDGHKIWRRNKWEWVALYGVVVVAFVQIVAQPAFAVTKGSSSFGVMIYLLVAFTALSVAFWVVCSVRHRRRVHLQTTGTGTGLGDGVGVGATTGVGDGPEQPVA
jgi:hypothetical protein